MRREGTIGAATVLAIAAVVGFSAQTGPKPQESVIADRNSTAKRSKPAPTKVETREDQPGCGSLREQLEDFLEIPDKELVLPPLCYEEDDPRRNKSQIDLNDKTSQLKFVIALVPDPVHTHLPVVFDQFAVAIQEAAQDERYEFDGSWLPWDDEETPYALFLDEKAANREKELKETQPGIFLFRKTVDCGNEDPESLSKQEAQEVLQKRKNCQDDWKNGQLGRGYRAGLIVFVVGEEATHGIHKEQFRNALNWVDALGRKASTEGKPLAILGPTYSGSLPSLAQVLSEPEIDRQLGLVKTSRQTTPQTTPPQTPPDPLCKTSDGNPLAVYSGSVTSKDLAQAFQCIAGSQVEFHSFLQNDDTILRQFCDYISVAQKEFNPGRVAIISEDETAYGGSGLVPKEQGNEQLTGQKKAAPNTACPDLALKLYYPRDISALRGAYQTKSLFDTGTAPQPADTQRRNLPTDLADPSGKVHDSIRSYGGNQTPLTQEAFLMDMVAALRELHARYIFLRSSNTLDQLFLTNFLRRNYPDGRIVIFGSDLMFIREQGATGLNGTMTLSTYPLFPLEHRWTDQRLMAADRVFSSDTSEGTYVALRLLLNDKSLQAVVSDGMGCHVTNKELFLPSVACGPNTTPIPDYAPPFWIQSDQHEENQPNQDTYAGPATWLAVVGVNRFWPLVSFSQRTSVDSSQAVRFWRRLTTPDSGGQRAQEPGGLPEIPLGMKVFLLVLVGFSLFHAWCCWFGSYTSKPAFRAHFASPGEWRHTWLVLKGSCCVAFLAVVAGWGCGVFFIPYVGLPYPWFALFCMILTCLMAWVAVYGHVRTGWLLTKSMPSSLDLPGITDETRSIWHRWTLGIFAAVTALFSGFFVVPLEWVLTPENRVLTYWRATHLDSGVSAIVPILSILVTLYLVFWFKLHGLALFGPDRPLLPPKEQLALKDAAGKERDFLRMFSQEDAAETIERAAIYSDPVLIVSGVAIFFLFLFVPWTIAEGVPLRSLGHDYYAIIFLVALNVCCTTALVESWRLHKAWEELKRLLGFLDRLALRRTMAVLRGFSWGSVWKMSGNVLDVRYKVISRQMECMNHTIASLEALPRNVAKPAELLDSGAQSSLNALLRMREAGAQFAIWYSKNYTISRAGDLGTFGKFQESIAAASGTLFAKLLVPEWRTETGSLLAVPIKVEKDEATPDPPPQAKEEHIRNAEEFVCLNYLGFVQNILGRLRTIAVTIVLLFLAATMAISTYPFDPRQALSVLLIALFVITGAVMVKVYAEMYRDTTLSNITNTKPGELGTEFWFKIVGFGVAPLLGLLTRVFPGISDFILSWLQPGISSLK